MYRHDSELHGSSSDEIYMVDLSSKVMVKLPVCRHLGGGGGGAHLLVLDT